MGDLWKWSQKDALRDWWLICDCRHRSQTPSSAHKTTLLSTLPPTSRTAVRQALKTWTLRSSPQTHRSWTTRQAPRQQASSRMRPARRRRRRSQRQALEGGGVYRQQEEEEAYPHVVARRGGQEEVGLREGRQEGGEGASDVLLRKRLGRGITWTCVDERKQYTTDSLLLSKF